MFQLDNIFIQYTILALLAITIFVISIHAYRHYSWNRLLYVKRLRLRLCINEGKKTRHVSLLMQTALAPIMVIVVAILVSINGIPRNYKSQFNTGDDIIAIYEEYQTSLISDITKIVDDTESILDATEYDYSFDASNNEALHYQVSTTSFIDANSLYILTESSISIYSNESSQSVFQLKQKAVLSDYLSCSENITPLEVKRQTGIPLSYYQSTTSCNINDSNQTSINQPSTIIFHWNGSENSPNFIVLSGTQIFAQEYETGFVVATKSVIPFGDDNLLIDDFLPFWYQNGVLHTSSYSDIEYTQDAGPEAFVTIFYISSDFSVIESKTFLTGEGTNVFGFDNQILLVQGISENSDAKTPEILLQTLSIDALKLINQRRLPGVWANQSNGYRYNNQVSLLYQTQNGEQLLSVISPNIASVQTTSLGANLAAYSFQEHYLIQLIQDTDEMYIWNLEGTISIVATLHTKEQPFIYQDNYLLLAEILNYSNQSETLHVRWTNLLNQVNESSFEDNWYILPNSVDCTNMDEKWFFTQPSFAPNNIVLTRSYICEDEGDVKANSDFVLLDYQDGIQVDTVLTYPGIPESVVGGNKLLFVQTESHIVIIDFSVEDGSYQNILINKETP